ncbi:MULTISPECIES: aldo/keto reductase [unclassified Tenacibaculum]|uniref:aldo/keto reductase n=1 Tax=unclassified Tenacibaculum TaxID=2635139 RepID=UPI001F395B1E|nr:MULTISPECIES: aldo/keto reductase [unclassified Tenacibaculum]MCF2875811.1 aldo/keto reductase [Tenacibaculum sp. Cn5-1]MCF2935886.1 aldo/keto reductase [Tenacibaculum sp. Cn5-34]MCG7512447.1 aldo/keto reductase [Tenacibaculum sp. Cn5-46]
MNKYINLGKTGLKVSRIAFGAGTFGNVWGDGWSISKDEARCIFNTYLDSGMNFIDTANVYQAGESEKWVGELLKERGGREKVVISTKYTMSMDANNPLSGGNGKGQMIREVEESLKRLQTDYIDILYLHHWDTNTPVEEVMKALDTIVQSGKVRYVGFSNFPAWYLGKAEVLARWHGWEQPAAIQMEYNMLERTIEREFTTYAKESGIGIFAWSPLANGLLTGRYEFDLKKREIMGSGRVTKNFVTDPFIDPFSEQSQHTINTLKQVAEELNYTPAQIATAWILHQPNISGLVAGASKVNQIKQSIEALEINIPKEQLIRLNEVSKPALSNPYSFHSGAIQNAIHGNVVIGK